MKRVPKLTTRAVTVMAIASFVLGAILFVWGSSIDNAASDLEADYAPSLRVHRSTDGDDFDPLFSSSGTRPTKTAIRYESEVEDSRIGAELFKQLGAIAVLLSLFFIPVAFVVHREQKPRP